MAEGSCGVLVVEDEAVLRLLLTAVLDDEGFAVHAAANGHEALLILALWQPEIIVLDLQMPVMDGPSFCAEQRRSPSLAAIPVLLVSAALDLKRQAMKLEAAGSIGKPYDVDELIKTVNQILATKRSA
ncbi:MAG TPA: response regulator [Chloroflexota bacterium]|nr:response regulator [Chloroflexota bacterium]